VLAQQWGPQKKQNFAHTHSLGDEDDAQTSNTRVAQRKHAMKNNRNIIECCNNIHQGASRSGKQTCTCTSDLVDASHVTCIL